MAPIGVVAAVVGAVGAVAGGVISLQQGSKAAKAQRQNAELARLIGERNAQIELERAGIEEARLRRSLMREQATRASRFAASGVRVGEGSPLAVLADAAAEAEELALLVRYEGQLAAEQARFSGLLSSRSSLIQADQSQAAGLGAAIGAFGQAGGSLLTEDLFPSGGGADVPYFLAR